MAAQIRKIRIAKGLTQTELANRCEFEKASLSRIESGKTNITVLTLLRICMALETSADQFFKSETSIDQTIL